MVTSERRAQANRANARRSTGPTSAAGKARAAQNARRHGLSQDILADPALGQEVEDLAQRIAREAQRPDLIDLARRIAQAQMDVQRIRQFRQERMQAAVAGPGHAGDGHDSAPTRVRGADALAEALAPLRKELKAVDRYMRRALSRRKFAVRDFAVAQGQDAGGLKASAATPARAKRGRPWRPKSERALGEILRWQEEFRQECDAAIENLAAARARRVARRHGASLTQTNALLAEIKPPETGG